MQKGLLIVDDHELFREGLVSLFKAQQDFNVLGQVGTVHDAVEAARTLRPDLILMDFSLPDGTGADATEQIISFLPQCRIVFLTVYETDEQLFAGIRSGAAGYLLKHLPFSKLLASLRSLERGEPAISRQMIGRLFKEIAHTQPSRPSNGCEQEKLSKREVDILVQLSSGASNEEIARSLVLSVNTVKHHIHNILDKLSLQNRREAGQFARQNGFVQTRADRV